MGYPIVHQSDSMLCGIACLQMICKSFGKEHSTTYLEKLCFATDEGVSLLGIGHVANKIGLSSRSIQTTIEGLVRNHGSYILHWNQNHFVVLYKVKNDKTFYIANPAKGVVKYNIWNPHLHFMKSK